MRGVLMEKIDTSTEAVEKLAKRINASCGCASGATAEQPVAGTLRALLAERDEARAEVERLKAQPAQAVKVKRLVWERDPEKLGEDWFWRAVAGPFVYEVGEEETGLCWWQEDAVTGISACRADGDIEAAKAAAQADYEARIMAAMDVQPVTVHDAARDVAYDAFMAECRVIYPGGHVEHNYTSKSAFLAGWAAALRAIAEGRA